MTLVNCRSIERNDSGSGVPEQVIDTFVLCTCNSLTTENCSNLVSSNIVELSVKLMPIIIHRLLFTSKERLADIMAGKTPVDMVNVISKKLSFSHLWSRYIFIVIVPHQIREDTKHCFPLVRLSVCLSVSVLTSRSESPHLTNRLHRTSVTNHTTLTSIA